MASCDRRGSREGQAAGRGDAGCSAPLALRRLLTQTRDGFHGPVGSSPACSPATGLEGPPPARSALRLAQGSSPKFEPLAVVEATMALFRSTTLLDPPRRRRLLLRARGTGGTRSALSVDGGTPGRVPAHVDSRGRMRLRKAASGSEAMHKCSA